MLSSRLRTLPSVRAAASSNAMLALPNFLNCFSFIRLHTPSTVSASLAKSSRFKSVLSRALNSAYPADVSVKMSKVMVANGRGDKGVAGASVVLLVWSVLQQSLSKRA